MSWLAYLGLEILAFPCNQFGEEEPGSNDQIVEFVCTRFKSEFPIFGKVGQHISLVSKVLLPILEHSQLPSDKILFRCSLPVSISNDDFHLLWPL